MLKSQEVLKKYSLLVILIIFSTSRTFSQCQISGKIAETSTTAIPYAAIALINSADSSIYKGALTDDNGKYCFNEIKKGIYLIKISAVGFADTYSEKIQFDSTSKISVPDILIKESSVNLKEVSVSAIKKPIEFKNGNITVNIEGSPLAVGNSLYDVLSRMPGIIIDNDVITIQGNEGVKVFIDDRIQQMSGQQLVNMLRSIMASSVEKIEIIKNPPVKYDAAGTAGIINIKTKKVKITGFSGNVNYTFSQGYYATHTPGFSMNYKWKKLVIFSSVDAYAGRLHHEDNFKKSITYNSVTTVFDQKSIDYDSAKYLTANLGADWYINKKNTLGFKFQYVPGYAFRTKPGNNYLSDNSLGYTQLNFNRSIPNTWDYKDYNFNAEHLFDTLGTKLVFVMDYYAPYHDLYSGTYENRFLDNNGNEVSPAKDFKSNNAIDFNILWSKLDFEKKFSKTLSMEAGAKGSLLTANSDYLLENKDNASGIYSQDPAFTNKFTYHEQITAGYFNMHKQLNKVNLQAGIRGENTDIHTESITSGLEYNRLYFNLFPVLSMDYNKSDNHIFQLSYNRRIYRQDYSMFNPYKLFVNLLTSEVGNPYLLPSYGNSINISHIYKGSISNSLSVTKIDNGFLNYTTQNDSTKESTFKTGNIQTCYNTNYSLFINTDIKKWWSFTFNGNVIYQKIYGTLIGSTLDYSTLFFNLYTNNQFLIGKSMKVEFGGFYSSPRVTGMYHFQSRFGLHVAVKKTFLHEKLNLSIGVYDMFFTNINRVIVNFQDQQWEGYQSFDSRRLNLSISYNFGNLKVQQREIAVDEGDKERLNH